MNEGARLARGQGASIGPGPYPVRDQGAREPAMCEGVMEPARNQGASKGPGSKQGARQPVSGLGSSAMSHRASKPAMSGAMEPAINQGANEGN